MTPSTRLMAVLAPFDAASMTDVSVLENKKIQNIVSYSIDVIFVILFATNDFSTPMLPAVVLLCSVSG